MVEEDVVRTSVYLPRVLYEKARQLGINISEVTRLALVTEIRLRERYLKEFEEEYLFARGESFVREKDLKGGGEGNLTDDGNRVATER